MFARNNELTEKLTKISKFEDEMKALIDDFDFNLEQINEIEHFNRAKIEKISKQMSSENSEKFNTIIEAQKSLGELEEQIDRKIAL